MIEKIKLQVFDVFGYLLPGLVLALTINLCIVNIPDLIVHISNISKKSNNIEISLIILSAYLLGFVNNYFGYEVFKFLSKRIWKKRMEKEETSFGKQEMTLVEIRHFSPNNFDLLQKWFSYRGMAYGLFLSLLVLFIVLTLRTVCENSWNPQRIILAVTILICAIVSLRRSITFHEWASRLIKHSKDLIDRINK